MVTRPSYFRSFCHAFEHLGAFRWSLPEAVKGEYSAAKAKLDGDERAARQFANQAAQKYSKVPFGMWRYGSPVAHILRISKNHGLSEKAVEAAKTAAFRTLKRQFKEPASTRSELSLYSEDTKLVAYLDMLVMGTGILKPKELAEWKGVSQRVRVRLGKTHYRQNLRFIAFNHPSRQSPAFIARLHGLNVRERREAAIEVITEELKAGRVLEAASLARLHDLREAKALAQLARLLGQKPVVLQASKGTRQSGGIVSAIS